MEDRIWSFVSAECKQLIKDMLHHDPDDRMRIEALQSHAWVMSNPAMIPSGENTIQRKIELFMNQLKLKDAI